MAAVDNSEGFYTISNIGLQETVVSVSGPANYQTYIDPHDENGDPIDGDVVLLIEIFITVVTGSAPIQQDSFSFTVNDHKVLTPFRVNTSQLCEIRVTQTAGISAAQFGFRLTNLLVVPPP